MKIDLRCPVEVRKCELTLFDRGLPRAYIQLFNLANAAVSSIEGVAHWLETMALRWKSARFRWKHRALMRAAHFPLPYRLRKQWQQTSKLYLPAFVLRRMGRIGLLKAAYASNFRAGAAQWARGSRPGSLGWPGRDAIRTANPPALGFVCAAGPTLWMPGNACGACAIAKYASLVSRVPLLATNFLHCPLPSMPRLRNRNSPSRWNSRTPKIAVPEANAQKTAAFGSPLRSWPWRFLLGLLAASVDGWLEPSVPTPPPRQNVGKNLLYLL